MLHHSRVSLGIATPLPPKLKSSPTIFRRLFIKIIPNPRLPPRNNWFKKLSWRNQGADHANSLLLCLLRFKTLAHLLDGLLGPRLVRPLYIKYVPKLAKSKVDAPVDSDSSNLSKSPSSTVPDSPKPVKCGSGRPKGSKNAKAASQLDTDPSHIHIAIPPLASNNPMTNALHSLTSHLEEASEVRLLFL